MSLTYGQMFEKWRRAALSRFQGMSRRYTRPRSHTRLWWLSGWKQQEALSNPHQSIDQGLSNYLKNGCFDNGNLQVIFISITFISIWNKNKVFTIVDNCYLSCLPPGGQWCLVHLALRCRTCPLNWSNRRLTWVAWEKWPQSTFPLCTTSCPW